jgi:hypothetical protein
MKLDRLVITLAALTACSDGNATTSAESAFPDVAYTSVTTEGGTYRVEVRTAPVQPPTRGNVDVEVRVTDPSGAPIDGVAIGVVPWMPADGHGASVIPIVSPDGSGRYRVTNVNLFMPGSWQLRMTLQQGGNADHAVATIDVK